MATTTLYPSKTITGSNSTWANESNAYKGHEDSTSTATLTFSKLATTTMYGFLGVDTASIPANATISSVSVTTRIRIKAAYGKGSNGSWTSCGAILCSGSMEKGTIQELSGNDTATNLTMSGASWTAAELQDLRIKYSYTTNSYGSFDSAAVMTVYGATVTITYTGGTAAKTHTITIQTGEGISIDKNATNTVSDKESFEITITPSGSTTITSLTDNGTNVLNQLQEVAASGGSNSVTSYPTAYTTSGSSISGTRYKNCIGKGSDTTATGNDYCGRNNATANIIYSFDFSSIPENATINSVSVKVGGHLENTSRSTATLQLLSGATTKGTSSKFTSTSKQVITMPTATWTRAELQNAKLQFTIGYYGGLVNGVDFVVNYSTPASSNYYKYTINSVTEDHAVLINMAASSSFGTLMSKTSNNWTTLNTIDSVYKKVNGTWVKQTDLNNLIDSNVKYIKQF